MAITPLPTLARASATFKAEVDTYMGTLIPAFTVEANALQVDVVAKQVTASAAAATAVVDAATATAQAVISTAKAVLTAADRVQTGLDRTAAELSRIAASKLNLGSYATGPTVDNQGATLLAGSTYYDTALSKWRVWTGSAWADGVSSGSAVASATTPAPLGTAAVGVATAFARGDHVHLQPTLTTLGAQAAGTYATGTGTASGTNTGDQTAIVGISGTLVQFNTAVTDADLVSLLGIETLTNKTLTSPTLTAPVLGTPISGNLSNTTVDGTNAIGFRHIPQIIQSVAYTLVLTDAGKHILHPSADATARIFTIPANATVAFPIGTAVTFANQASAGVMTIAITTDVMRLAGAGTTGSRTLAANGVATAIKLTATEWIVSGSGLT